MDEFKYIEGNANSKSLVFNYDKYELTANTMTDEDALKVVKDYFKNIYGYRTDNDIPFNLFVVWKCKTIQNVKFIVGTSNNHLIELTFNGDKDELYIDVYKKERKVTIKQKY